MPLSKMCLLVVLMRKYCLGGLLSSMSGPVLVGCMGYNVVFCLCRSMYLVCHIVRPVLDILRIGMHVRPVQI